MAGPASVRPGTRYSQAVSSSLDLDTVLTTIVTRAAALSHADGGSIFEFDASTREFVQLFPDAEYAMMDRTGHIGLVTQPDRFARIVGEFVNASSS